MYDTLFYTDTATKKVTSKILSEWKYSDDTTFVMTLKAGIKFANGDTATADDLLFSVTNHFERVTANTTLMGPIDVKNCTSDGKLTVTIKYTQPYGPGLTCNVLYLYDKAWAQKAGWKAQDWYSNPNGSGPYKVAEYANDDHITLTLRPDYWNAANEKYSVEKWIIKYYPDAATMDIALERGDISFCGVSNTADYTRYSTGSGVKNISVYKSLMGDVGLFEMGYLSNKIFYDKNVREALAYGVDWAAVGKMGSGDLYQQPSSIICADSLYHKDVGFYKYDLEKAKKVLKDAGFKDGDVKIHIYTMQNDSYKNMVEGFQYYCSQMGIKVDIEFGDVTSALAKWQQVGGTDGGFMNNNTGSIAREPYVTLMSMTGKLFPWTYVDEQTFNKTATDAVATVDTAKRKTLYEQLQQYAYDNFLVFPISEAVSVTGYRNDVFTEAQMKTWVYNSGYVSLQGLSRTK